VGQLGFLLLQDNPTAKEIVARLCSLGPNPKRLAYLYDDLRLARLAILPILAAHLVLTRRPFAPAKAFEFYPQGWTIHKAAAIAAYHRGDLHVYVPAGGGAVTRIYSGNRLIVEDLGVDIEENDATFTARTYGENRSISPAGNGLSFSVAFGELRYLSPSFLQKIVLRVCCATPTSSRITRALIDRYRLKHRSAINQSASAVGKGNQRFSLLREVVVDKNIIRIVDLLRDQQGAMSSAKVSYRLWVDGRQANHAPTTLEQELQMTKTLDIQQDTLTPVLEMSHA
jgi:hypothetical protein